MTITVLDSTDTAGILADAGITLDAPTGVVPQEGEVKPEVKAGEKPAEGQEDPDDVEGDDGLTPRQKRDLTSTMQKAIGKKHRMLREAEEFAAAQYSERKLAEQRAAQLEREYNELKGKMTPATAAPQEAAKPVRENFASEYEYVDAMIQYGVDQRLQQKAEEDAKASLDRRNAEILETAKGRIAKALELVPDYAEVTGAVDTEVPRAIAGYMQKSEMFAELGYHLAKNPELLVSLAKLPPDEQLVKIGKIESTLTPFEARKEPESKLNEAASDGKTAKVAPSNDTGIDLSKPRSKPAPVITPLDGSGSAGASKDSKDMNVREAIEDYAKRNRANLGARKRH